MILVLKNPPVLTRRSLEVNDDANFSDESQNYSPYKSLDMVNICSKTCFVRHFYQIQSFL